MITLKWNTKRWVNTVTELRRFKNMDVPEFVRHRARVLTQDLIKWTPPRGRKPSGESFATQKKRGLATIRRDCNRTFTACDKLKVVTQPANAKLAAAFLKAIRSNDAATLKVLLDQIGITAKVVLPEPSLEIHRKARTRRGTVPGRQMWFVPRQSQINNFAAKLSPDVGKAKSGWGAPARLLGVPPKNWPLWIQRHGDNGHVEDRTRNLSRPIIRMINDRPEVKEMDQEEIVDAAIFVNEGKMETELKAIWAWEKQKAQRLLH